MLKKPTMNLVWTKDFNEKSSSHSDYECRPIVWNNKLFYAYHSIDIDNQNQKGYFGTKISVVEVNLKDATSTVKCISFKYKEPNKKEILLSNNWQFQIIKDKIFLYVGFLLDLNETSISVADIDYKLEEFKIKTDYYFNKKHLKYNQLSTIECFDNETDKQLWKVIIKGYLYTDIGLQNNCLTFGTAGKGGAFYCINLDNGNVLTEYINNGCSNFAWQDNTIILRDKKGDLFQINPYTNQVVNDLKLNDKLFYAPILVDGNYIYTTVYSKTQNIAKLICVKNE